MKKVRPDLKRSLHVIEVAGEVEYAADGKHKQTVPAHVAALLLWTPDGLGEPLAVSLRVLVDPDHGPVLYEVRAQILQLGNRISDRRPFSIQAALRYLFRRVTEEDLAAHVLLAGIASRAMQEHGYSDELTIREWDKLYWGLSTWEEGLPAVQPKRRHRVTSELLEKVATAYLEGYDSGAPTEAVAEKLGLKKNTARKYVVQACDAGWLERTGPGKRHIAGPLLPRPGETVRQFRQRQRRDEKS